MILLVLSCDQVEGDADAFLIRIEWDRVVIKIRREKYHKALLWLNCPDFGIGAVMKMIGRAAESYPACMFFGLFDYDVWDFYVINTT